MLLKFTFKHKKFISFLLILCTVFSMCSQFLTVFAVDGSGIENEIAEKGNISDYSELNDIGLSETEAIKPNDALLTIDHPSIAKESMISKYVNAEAFNKASHVERLHSEEDLNTYVFLNANGTKSIYYMYENVKYVDKNGDVKEKDISLVSKSDGYGIARNEFDLHIPISATSGISVSYNGYEVKITPQSTARTAPARQAGETVVYDGFFGTNTSLVYTPMLSGVKEDIILNKYIPNASFSFILETDGLGLYSNNEGYYLAESESSKAVLRLGKVIIYDAVGKPEYGTMAVKTVTDKQKYILSLSAPEEFLTDPTTVYPVTIDPTLTFSDTATGEGAIEDTVLFSGRPSRNYGDYKYLSIGYVDSTYGAGRVAVKLPGLYNSADYNAITASNITSVKFYCWDTSGNSAQTVNLYRITSAAWNENSVTFGDSVTYSTSQNWGKSMPNGAWTDFDITTLVKGWKNGSYSADKGFIMVNPNETSSSYKKAPYSSETTTSYRPYVVMSYDPGVAPISSGTYYLNSWGTSHFLNNNGDDANGIRGSYQTIRGNIGWQLIHYANDQYLIKSTKSPCLYLSPISSSSENVQLINMTSVESKFLWKISVDPYDPKLQISDCWGRILSTSSSISSNASSIEILLRNNPEYSYEWRYENINDFSELTTFSCNTTEVNCFEKKQFRVVANVYDYSFVDARDFEYSLVSGSANIALTPSGLFKNIKGKNVGNASIKITYKVTNISKTFAVNINPFPFVVGFSTENYNAGCPYGDRGSLWYAQTFFYNLSLNSNYELSYRWHFNDSDEFLPAVGASKEDFGRVGDITGEISWQADFMVYIGHGIAADRDGNETIAVKGNYLHYNYDSSGNSHDNNSDCYDDEYNLYTSEARFSHPRWVWLYTCNFLANNDYVSDAELKDMMNGTHILLGYATQCTLAGDVSQRFALELSLNKSIIDSFFIAGDQAEVNYADSNHLQKALYVEQAREETIFSEPIKYNYTASDIKIITNDTNYAPIWS